MDAGSVLIILAATVIVGAFVAQPFWKYRKKIETPLVKDPLEHQYSSLLAEKDRLAQALQELDFDHALGKIPQEDYPIMRAELLKHAAEVLHSLGKIEKEMGIGILPSDDVQQIPGENNNQQVPSADEIEELIRARRQQRQGKATGFCPKCGNPIQKSDRFCPRCGNALMSLSDER